MPVLTLKLFDPNHLKTFEILLFRVLDYTLTESFLKFQERVLSSENKVGMKKKIELLGKTLMKMRNKRGPVIEPWGTSQSTGQHSVVRLFSDTICILFVK